MHFFCFIKSINYHQQSLLKCNSNVNVRDRDGLTPAMWACHMDNQKNFDLVTSSPSNRITENDGIERDILGRTWIHWAVRRSEPLKCLKVSKRTFLFISDLKVLIQKQNFTHDICDVSLSIGSFFKQVCQSTCISVAIHSEI